MNLYKKMYYSLFNSVTDAIEAKTKEEINEILIQGQIKTEEMYISSTEEEED